MTVENTAPNFVHDIIDADLASGKHHKIITRFPPEPSGYAHLGHVKAITLNFGAAKKYGGQCHLRFDDTNPAKEEPEYVEAMKRDIEWLGYTWGENLFFASDYFPQLYEAAVQLVKNGDAYVDSLSAEDIREYRGTLKEPGKNSPYRDRSVEENLQLLKGMKNGEYDEGSHILRAKIDMSHPNINMRDPAIYRIRKATHGRTGDTWSIYPMYDFAHCVSDAIENITHSLCSLEFEDHRPLYDWFLEKLDWPKPRPRQYEFARLNLPGTVTSKRHLRSLIEAGKISGWDDPRLPTISGLRRRGLTPQALQNFCERIGVSKRNSEVEPAFLDFCVREDLNKVAQRRMAVLNPLKLVITNYPADKEEMLPAENNPEDENAGEREMPFCNEVWVERDDYMDDAPKKFFRLSEGRTVRLKHAYYVTCNEVIRDDKGEVIELRGTYDPDSRGGWNPDGPKVKGTLHWVSARHAKTAEVRTYGNLLSEDSDPELSYVERFNENSLVVSEALIEPALAEAQPGEHFQFLRKGYYTMDPDSTEGKPVFNLTVGLVDTWAKKMKNQAKK